MNRVTLRVLAAALSPVPITTGAVLAQAPRGLARTALDDSAFTWIRRDRSGFRVYFAADSYASRHADSLARRLPAARAHLLTLLGAARFDSTIDVFFVESRPQMERLVGRRATGFADVAGRTVLLMTNPGWRAFERHELMHVLAGHLWGRPAAPADWLDEGLAQFADGRCAGFDIDTALVALARDQPYFPFDILTQRFRQLDDLAAYLQAASMVRYIYREHGPDGLRRLWHAGIAAIHDVLGTSPSDLEAGWRAALPTPGPAPTAPQTQWIREHGCG